MQHSRLLLPVIGLLFMTLAAACNEKTDDTEDLYTPSDSVAVSSFKLTADSKVLSSLDKVFFSIDLTHRVIYNADSLPVGTDVSKLIPVITYPNTVTAATIRMSGGTLREGDVNYLESPTDTIDFTGHVSLILQAGSDLTAEYRLKVNVHKTNPDTIAWSKGGYAPFPSRMANPRTQKTVNTSGSSVASLIEEADGTYTLSSAPAPDGAWTKTALQLPFVPRIRTLEWMEGNYYMLASDGRLMESPDGADWKAAGPYWRNIIGVFGGRILGLRNSADGVILHTQYPLGDYTETEIDSEFPVEYYSNLGVFATRWSNDPTAFIVGGQTAAGQVCSSTWAFDGSNWAEISSHSLPAVKHATLIPYFAYRKTSESSWKLTEYSVWLAVGGIEPTGAMTRKLYLSYDNGVNWTLASGFMQLPDFIPSFRQADAIVANQTMTGNYDSAWTQADTPRSPAFRINYEIDGTGVTWECPYIYLFGGITLQGELIPNINRAVLARLSFIPLI